MREYDAQCVTNAAEVRELMGMDAVDRGAAVTSDPDRTRLLDALSVRTARPPAELARAAGLPPERVRALLGALSLDGEVAEVDGGWRRSSR
jgi:DNA processing protein